MWKVGVALMDLIVSERVDGFWSRIYRVDT